MDEERTIKSDAEIRRRYNNYETVRNVGFVFAALALLIALAAITCIPMLEYHPAHFSMEDNPDQAVWLSRGKQVVRHISIASERDGAAVTKIDMFAFSGCRRLRSVDIPSSIENIGDEAFFNCERLESVDIPEGVTFIGDDAFSGCASLESVTIPASAERIGLSPFADCASLEEIIVEPGNGFYYSENGVLYFRSEDWNALIQYPAGKTETSFTVPDGVESILAAAFRGCGKIESVTIPESVETIGDRAFVGCGKLSDVTIPESVRDIGEVAFNTGADITIHAPHEAEYYHYEPTEREHWTTE